MSSKRHTPEQIINKLGRAEVAVTRDLFAQILTRNRLLSPVPT